MRLAEEAGVAIIRSRLKTAEFYRLIKPFLTDQFAPVTTMHGSLADVYGVGLFFTGESGIGKSECVLDLVERGHRLVADDLVFVSRRDNDVLIGRGHELQRHFMEIRGVGLLDIPAIFHMIVPPTAGVAERTLSVEIAVVLIVTYILSLYFSLRTHKHLYVGDAGEHHAALAPSASTGR